MRDEPDQSASYYRGWRYLAFRRSRFGWDIDYKPAVGVASVFLGSPFWALTRKGSEAKFKRFVDRDIADRLKRQSRETAMGRRPSGMTRIASEELAQ